MKLQTLRIDVRPEPLEWFDKDDAEPRVLLMDIEANHNRYHFRVPFNPDFFESDFEGVMRMITERVKLEVKGME